MQESKKISPANILRNVTVATLLAGAVISVGLTLHTGRNNHSVLLVALFIFWVFSPFAGLLAACLFSRRWTVSARVILYIIGLVISACSLAGYSGIWAS